MAKTIAALILVLGLSLIIAQPMNNHSNNQTGACPMSGDENMMPGGPSSSCGQGDNIGPIAEGPDNMQGDPNQMDMQHRPMGPMGNPQEMLRGMKKPQEMVETIRIWKLTELLNLSEDQSTRFFPKLKAMKQLRDDYEENRMKAINELEGMLHEGKNNDKMISDKLAEIEQYDTKFHTDEAKMRKDIASTLTPEQQAKFMLFQMRFEDELRMAIHKAQGMKKEAIKKWQENRPFHNRQWKIW